MSIPTEADWGSGPRGLDGAHAYKNFNGWGLAGAVTKFEENASSCMEDLVYMPLPCFRYYVQAYVIYLISEASRGDADGASAFIHLVEARKKDIQSSSDELKSLISIALDRVEDGQTWFNASEEIYGNLESRVAGCLDACGPF